MTPPRGPAQSRIVVLGAALDAGEALRTAGITEFDVLGKDVASSVFADDTDTWTLTTADGETVEARVVIAAAPLVPWTPNIPGRNTFAGQTCHAASWNPDFDPAGKHVAVIGTDSAAGHRLGSLSRSAASVTVFAHPPRRFVADMPSWSTRVKHRILRRTAAAVPPGEQSLVGTAIEALTPSGIRTRDGVEHRADAIIYGTGYRVGAQTALVGARGLSIHQAWHDGMEPFFGVAVHGFPNYFFVTGPDSEAQTRYVVECLKLMARTTSSRIEVRRSSEQVFNERAQLRPAQPPALASAFDLSSSAPEFDDTYEGAATLELAGARLPVNVRLTGRLEPIDGNYHWQGTVFDRLPAESLKQTRAATLSIGTHSAPARIVEETPWGTHSVAGVGAPPYAR
ncbi:hypothetical protein MKUB_44120 [Mycobacterium kubicae]|uniref:DUF4873 domain-containing protein n=1 Tax=Mycobacterium kubicae TaxID=120959 RepID=A0AAX1J6B2_9MYCO|nr:DUF4873 domain-containing protein [Mycobacterium kubicae]MCV7098551.1 DUF4873 domain-containing protein [Mycobacterium kubicae]QPI37023.1 DUF4873 domain-containing protein [Mycobacterium kubicae]GFG66922.1 hypothetical protein MKUB_44120 [Mycobacterium kubicae]